MIVLIFYSCFLHIQRVYIYRDIKARNIIISIDEGNIDVCGTESVYPESLILQPDIYPGIFQ